MSSGRKKRIVVDFIGGLKDGYHAQSDSDDVELAEAAVALQTLTDGCPVGSLLKMCSDDEISDGHAATLRMPQTQGPKRPPVVKAVHFYEMTQRSEDDVRVAIRFEYRGCERQMISLPEWP